MNAPARKAMKKARRVPRKIGGDEDEEGGLGVPTAVVQRPAAKTKKASSLRTSFAPDEFTEIDNDDSSKFPTKTSPRQLAIYRRTELRSLASERLPSKASEDSNRPSYNADYLAELKESTPSTPPRHSKDSVSDAESPHAIDLTSESGAGILSLAVPEQPSMIPSDAEIREKKERRRRLAKEQDFISLDEDGIQASASDSEDDDPKKRSLILPAEEVEDREKYAETRLVHDDEDIAEGFEEFTEDVGKVSLGKTARREQERMRKQEMQDLIDSAQRDSGSDSADSDEEARNKAYEATQTLAGTSGSRRQNGGLGRDGLQDRLKAMPKISPLPGMDKSLAEFKQHVQNVLAAQEARRRKLAELKVQREELVQEREQLPILMNESAERYQKLREEIGIAEESMPLEPNEAGGHRGLESFGTMAALP